MENRWSFSGTSIDRHDQCSARERASSNRHARGHCGRPDVRTHRSPNRHDHRRSGAGCSYTRVVVESENIRLNRNGARSHVPAGTTDREHAQTCDCSRNRGRPTHRHDRRPNRIANSIDDRTQPEPLLPKRRPLLSREGSFSVSSVVLPILGHCSQSKHRRLKPIHRVRWV